MMRSAAIALMIVTILGPSVASASPTTSYPVSATAPTVQVQPQAPKLRVTGAVERTLILRIPDLQSRYDQHDVTTTFQSGSRQQTRAFTGPLLIEVLQDARPRLDPGQKNDALANAVLVQASDGYRAVLSWGEFDPGFGAKQVLLATTEDGRLLERPRLVVPGDLKGGRYVSNVDSIRLVDVARGR